MSYESFSERHLKVEVRDQIAIATLNRPAKRNAINYDLHQALEEAFHVLGHDPNVAAIVLTGAGTAFCAGGDVAGFYPEDHGPLSTLRCRHLVNSIVNCEAPVIAAVNGIAAGLGATVALLCDVVFMADSARIGDTHVNMGLVAGDGGAVIWPLLIGPHRAKEFLMTGKLATAEEAATMGLVNHVVAPERLLEEALAYAGEVAARPKPAVRWTKLLINQAVQQNMNLMLSFGYAVEQLSSHTEDQKEAVAAFFEKRKPKFTGK